jgi:2,4-dienoyl-CoA reductase-like NADH-dependent reductase (Old Yellow Enzyme family)/thioredoxin reductase
MGRLKLRNRVIMSAVLTNLASQRGEVTSQLQDFLVARARGGVGLVIVEGSYPEPSAQGYPNQLGLYDDSLVPGLRELVGVVKGEGARIVIQLLHMGRYALHPTDPNELSPSHIEGLVASFVQAAKRAQQAGFDGVEVMAGGGYLIDSFLSPHLNRREDEYGGELRGRARLLLQILDGIRAQVGSEFTLICKLGVDTREAVRQDVENLLPLLQDKVDAINVVPRWNEKSMEQMLLEMRKGDFSHLSQEVKGISKVPIIAGYGISNPYSAEEILREGKADFVAIARALVADPELPNRAEKGLIADIIPCISCNQGCVGGMLSGTAIACAVNATVGKEREYVLKPATQPKRVVVVGGGPGGMEAARVAALRGNEVILYEKERILGGQINLAAIPSHKREIAMVTQYLSSQLRKLGVNIVLGKEVDEDLLQELRPDAVIIASGARPAMPSLPGVERAVDFFSVLSGEKEMGERVVILGGGGNGSELARFLSENGKKVTIIERAETIIHSAGEKLRSVVSQRLARLGVEVISGAQAREIGEDSVIIDVKGEQMKLAADSVVVAIGLVPQRELYYKLKDKIPLYLIGDCLKPRSMMEAIQEGYEAGAEV